MRKRSASSPSISGRGVYTPRPVIGKGSKETVIVKNILKMLRKDYGGRWRKTHGSRYGTLALDIVGCLAREEDKYAAYFEVEVKRPRGNLTEIQAILLADVRRWRGITGCVHSVGEMQGLLAEKGFYPMRSKDE